MTSDEAKPQPISPHFDIADLSDDAKRFMATTPVNGGMPMVEDVYAFKPRTKWLPATVMPNMEKKVAQTLVATGIHAYLPLSADWRKQSRREKHMAAAKVRIERPLFPGYIFVEMPVERPPYHIITSIYGFRDFLRDTGHPDFPPVAIAGEVVDKLREKQEAGAFDATVKKGKAFIPKWAVADATVRIKDGPLACFEAMIRKVLPNDMIRVEASIFGRTTNIDMPIANVEAVC